jgi:PAP2 superfamily
LHLAHSLTMTHDAIVGYWVAAPGELRTPAAPQDLHYLSEVRRVQILLGAMSGSFRVNNPRAGAAEIHAGGRKIFETERPDETRLKNQMMLVANYADLRVDRSAEIIAQTADIMPFFGSIASLASPAKKHTGELLSAVQSLCVLIEMQVKHFCWTPRPIDFAPEIFPIIQTPDHSGFPSGHATEAFALATVLHRLMTGQNASAGVGNWAMPFRLAHRIAVNRTVAGVHFPIDSAAGALLGCAIGDAVAAIATGGSIAPRTFDAATFTGDFEVNWLRSAVGSAGGEAAAGNPLVALLWQMAGGEWAGSGR